MKKILCLLMSAFMLLAAGCSNSAEGEPVLPPTRTGKAEAHASLAKSYTFESAFAESDAVARVKVGNWLSENTDISSTYFEAELLECFKGDVPDTFVLKQDGSSFSTLAGYPLFSYGNELLLFLKNTYVSNNIEPDYVPDYEDVYWIIGAFTTVLDIAYDNEGNRYYADRYGILGETVNISINYAVQKSIGVEIYEYAAKSDPLVADIAGEQHFYSYAFSEADITALIDNLYDIGGKE